MKNQIKVLNKRVYDHTEEGMACGPFSITAIDAEMEVRDGENKVFLYGYWVMEAYDVMSFVAVTESILDIIYDMDEPGADSDELIKKINAIKEAGLESVLPGCDIQARYRYQFRTLKKMIKDQIIKSGYMDDYIEEGLSFDVDYSEYMAKPYSPSEILSSNIKVYAIEKQNNSSEWEIEKLDNMDREASIKYATEMFNSFSKEEQNDLVYFRLVLVDYIPEIDLLFSGTGEEILVLK